MDKIKIRLSMKIPGDTILSPQECGENPPINLSKKKSKRFIHSKKNYERIQRYAIHNISISETAYKYMLSTPTSPKFSKPVKINNTGETVERVWDTLSIDKRLREHFNITVQDFNAVSYSYQILGD